MYYYGKPANNLHLISRKHHHGSYMNVIATFLKGINEYLQNYASIQIFSFPDWCFAIVFNTTDTNV